MEEGDCEEFGGDDEVEEDVVEGDVCIIVVIINVGDLWFER